jgi:hypothetical protein
MTQLTGKECKIIGIAIGKLNILSQMVADGYWVDATQEEMEELLRKLEQIEKEANLEKKGRGDGV